MSDNIFETDKIRLVAEEPHPFLNHNPLHLVEGDFLSPPVVELGGAG